MGKGSVEMHAPPQNPLVGHVMVGVHVDPDGQPEGEPIVQGTRADEMGVGMQRPVQTEVNAHVWLG